MQAPRAYWPAWAERLQSWKLDTFAVWLLEAAGPLALLSAQALHFFYPLFPNLQMKELALMLEEDEETRAFIHYLHTERVG